MNLAFHPRDIFLPGDFHLIEDNMASYYFQRELGVEETNSRLAKENWPLHYWTARWYKPQEKEEFYIQFSPQGDFLGFIHVIAEDAPGAAIAIEEAQATAEDFLSQNSNWNPTDWERVEASRQQCHPAA